MAFSLDSYIHERDKKKTKNTRQLSSSAQSAQTRSKKNIPSKGFSLDDYIIQTNIRSGKQETDQNFSSWLDRVGQFSKRMSSSASVREQVYQPADAFSDYRSQTDREISDLIQQANAYKSYYSQYGTIYDEKYGAGSSAAWLDGIDQSLAYLKDVRSALDSEYNFWAQFEDEDAYNQYQAQTAEYSRLADLDLEDSRAKLATLEDQLRQAKQAKTQADIAMASQRMTAAQREQYSVPQADYDALSKQVDALRRDVEQAEYIQKGEQYRAYRDAEDFLQFSAQGAGIENPSKSEAEGVANLFGWRPGAQDVGNIVTYSRDNYESIAADEAQRNQPVGRSLYHFMTQDEVDVYNYLLAKEGETQAQEYLDYLEETLNARQGGQWAETIREQDNPILRTASTAAYGAGAGLDQFGSGIRQLFAQDRLPTTAAQYGSAFIREDLADTGPSILGNSLGQAAYDAVTTTANMAPSILLSALTGGAGASAAVASGLGAASLGASASGNAYGQALQEGYTPQQARAYSLLVGASEAGLQYLLGGVGSLGGKLTGKTAQAAVQNIDNALLRVAADLGVHMAGEGAEEYLQEILDPVFRNLMFDEDNEIKLVSQEAAYSFLLGAITAGLLEGGSITVNDLDQNKTGAAIREAGQYETLLGNAMELSPGSQARDLAQRMQHGDLTSSDINIGQLFAQYAQEGGNLDFMIAPQTSVTEHAGEEWNGEAQGQQTAVEDAIARMLEEQGLEGSAVQRQAAGVDRLVNGGELSSNLANELRRSRAAQAVYREMTGEDLDVSGTPGEIRQRLKELAASRMGEHATATQETEQGSAAMPGTQLGGIAPHVQSRSLVDRMAANSQVLGPVGKEAASALYDGSSDPDAYYQGYMQAYNAGLNNRRGEIPSVLTRAQYNDTFRAGQLDAKPANRGGGLVNNEVAQYARSAGRESGLVYDSFVRQAVESGRTMEDGNGETRVYLTADMADKMNRVAKALGVRVRFVDSISVNGQADAANAQIKGAEVQIQKDNENPVMFLIGHELAHRMQELAPREYLAFRTAVENDRVVQAAVKIQIENHARRGLYITYEQALDEAAADYAGQLMDGSKVLDDFIERNRDHRTLLQNVLDAIRSIINKLTGAEKKKAQTAENKLTAALEAAARQARRLQGENSNGTIRERYSAKEGTENGREGIEHTNEGSVRNNNKGTTRRSRENGAEAGGERIFSSVRMLSRGERPVHSWAEKGLIVPEPGSVAESEAHVVRGEYQLPVFVVKSDIFNQNHESAPAFSSSGQVFLREDLPEIGRGDIGAHEAGHAMKQMGYRPYLDFIEKTPDFIDMYNPIAKIFLEHAAKHIGIELGNMSEQDAIDLYDEINNMVYGAIHAERTEVLNLVRPAFYDFDAYSAELSSIHEQFKKERSNGTRFSLKSKDNQGQQLTQAQYKDALRAGRLDGKETVVRETSSVYTDTIYKQKGGAGTDGEAVHLRDGGQRAGGAYPGGQVSAVAQGAGGSQVWNWQGRSADGEASRLSYGEKVSTASLGIGGGSTQATVRLVTGGETAAMTKAKAEAKKRGLRLVFFAGDNLSIRDASGEMASVCGYISGDRVFVRVDHPMYTADQIMRHEAGHDMIKKGEVDIDAVRERIAEEFGADKTEALAKLYMDAYAGTGLSPEDVWEEVICDSLGDMNIFAKDVQAAAPAAWELLQETKKATENTRKAPARAPPAATDTKVGGKTSMDLDDLRDNIRKAPGIKWNGGRPIVLSRSEYAAVTSRISTRYHYANTRHDGVQIIDRTTDGKNAQHYVYLYTDHGFGSYQIVGRLSYGRNDALISFLREEIGNDRTAEGISQGAHQLRDFYEYPDSSGLSHYNGAAYDGNEQTHTGGRKGGEGSKRRTGRADTGRYDEGSVGEVKQNFSMETPVEQEETLVALHNMHEKKLRPSRAGQLDATSSNQAGGLVNNQAAKKLHNAATIDALARKLGVTVVAEETILGPDGRPGGVNGFIQDGVVHIALDAENPALVVFKHEITHLFQQRNASGYRAFRDYAVQVMGWAEVARIQALYRENRVELSWEEAMDEVAADFTQQLLTDQRAVRLLIQENRTLAQKMFDVIRDLARQLSDKEGAQLRKAEKMWIRMFEEAAGQDGTMEKRYSAKEDKTNGERGKEKLGQERGSEETVRQFYAEAERRGQTVRAFKRNGRSGQETIAGLGRFTEIDEADAFENAAQTKAELDALMVPSFIHAGDLEVLNSQGEVLAAKEDAATINHAAVGIANSIKISPKETAGHETYHFLKGKSARDDYAALVMGEIQWTGHAFSNLYDHINEQYFDGSFDMDDPVQYRVFEEELVAYISGMIHSGENLSGLLNDYDSVKTAWNNLVLENGGTIDRDSSGSSRFSMKSSMEEKGNLLAMHNLTESKPLSALRLGGFPIRDGGQRAGGAFPGGQVSAVAQGAGENQGRKAQGVAADTKAAGLSYGEKVSAASLGNVGGKMSRDYWRPNLTKAEWSLLNRKMETAGVELDEATYWTYASEKGTTIFGIYGIGDGTDNTPLYASGGATAVADAAKFKRFLEEFEHGSIEDRETLDRWSEALRRAERDVGGYLHDLAYGRADAGNVQVPGRAQGRAGRGASERGKSNRGGEVKQKFSMETPVEQEETLVTLHNMHEKKLRPSRAGQLDATSSNQAGGLVNNQAAKKLHNAATIDALARKLGVTVVAEETILGPDGRPGGVNGFIQDGVVHIALDAENPALVVFKHEITHLFQQRNASGYRAFRDYAVQVMGWAEVARIQALYRENRVELSWEEAMDEVAADFTQQLLTDQRAVRLLIQENRTLAQKMFDVIRDLARQLSGKEGTQLRKAEKMWIRMFEEAAGQENTSYDARGERYSTRAQRGRTIELETLENNRFQRLRQFKEQLPSEWYAFTADYFYVYSNQSFTDYTILVKARLTNANRADIEAFTEVLNHGTHEGTKTFDRWSEYFRRGKGRDRWHRVDTGKAGTAGRSDGVDVSASGSNHRGNPTPDSPTREATGIGRRDNPGPNTRYTLNQQDGRGQTSDLGEAATGHFARGTMQARDSEKEETRNGRARREETRDDFLRRSIQEGLQTVDGGQVVYGFRRLDRKSARQNARQVLEEVICLGLDADIIDGNQVIRNFDGVTTTRPVSQATTIARKHTLINNDTLLSPRNIAGHEAFHSWKNGIGRDLYIECLQDNLDFSSAAFLKYQSEVSQTIFGQEVDLSDSEQMGRFTEELYAYISGDIHEGANDEMLRPMFRDFDAVKAAWETLVWKNSRLTEYSASDGTRFPLSQEPGEDADQQLRSRGFTDAAGDAHTAVRYSLSQPDGRRMPVLANMPYATLASVSEHLDLLKRAKQGDHSAARKLIDATLKDDLIEQVVRYFPTAVITPVQGSREGNVLPLELAKAIVRRTQSPLFTQVYQQTHRAMKEQENSWARLLNPIFFDFEGERPDLSGQHFLLVDDVISSGSTLLALAHALEQAGGVVDGYVSLARGRFVTDDMAISHEVCQRLEQTIGRAAIQDFLAQHLGYPVILEHLTEKQGRAILAHKNEILAWAQTAQQLHGRDELTARYSIKKSRLSPSAASGQKYWRPKLTNQEWSLLERRIALEVERPENFLDGATKWLYAAEQGVNVFCIYGIGDGATPTPLYASGGKIAAREKAYLNEYLEGKNHGADRTWTAFNRRLAALSPGGVAKNRHLPQNGFPGEEAGDGALHWNPQRRDGGGVDGRGSRNRGGIDRSSEPGLPSRHTRLEEHPAKQKRFSRKQRNVRLGDAGVLPSRARKYFTVDKKRKNLTAEEYVQYASTKGQTAYDILMDLAEESAYWALSDGDKSKLGKDVYRYADVAGKASVSDYVPKGLDGELMALDAGGFDLADYLLLRAAGEADGRSDLEIAVSAGDSALSTQLVLWNYDAQRTAEAFTDPGRSGYEYQMDEVQQAQFADLYEGYMQQALNRLFESSRYQKADVQVRRDMVSQLQSETNAEVKKEMARQLRADGVKSVRKN